MEGHGEHSAISRCISFRADNCFSNTIDFYTIPDPFGFSSHGKNNNDVVLEPFLMSKSVPVSSKFVSVGPSLFCVGGFHNQIGKSVSKIYQLDTVHAAAGEDDDSAVMMLCPRMGHQVVVMDGKLYTMGGHDKSGIWGECFDPSSKKSSPLPLPPSDQLQKWGGVAIIAAPLHSSKKILVASLFPSPLDVVFLYRIEDKVWEELDHRVDFSAVRGEAAVLRNSTTLCFIRRMQVCAYDLVLRKWFISTVEGLDKVGKVEDRGMNYYSLFRLDDNHLCLLWQDYLGRPPLGILHFTKVQVSIDQGSCGEFIFKAFVVSSQSYEIERGAGIVTGLAYGFGEGDDGRTEAVDVTAPNWVPVQGRTGVGSSDGHAQSLKPIERNREGEGEDDRKKKTKTKKTKSKTNSGIEPRVGVELPKVEVRYNNLRVEAKCEDGKMACEKMVTCEDGD
ncbi:hypothetical protein Vadar_033060 [Vaccinium darrowii]|uniref:Uncharacterized protein n=1 Tax=Vaccinium darrowii TaxID=229202 RepID=A0ACB7XWK4_9ERIC|nr:hypothetical protein Vadar_033060 [Vaccinium darrowii]